MRYLITIWILLFATSALADTHYLATDGTDSGDCTGAACLTVQYAVQQMASGDVLEIADGTYTGNHITASVNPPDGPGIGSGDARFTIIKAENQGQVRLKSTSGHSVDLGSDSSYILFDGIVFEATAASNSNYAFTAQEGTNHIYARRCGFYGATGGASAFWYGGSYFLGEESYAWGNQRYGFHFHGSGSHHNVLRRCVARLDESDGGGNPIGGFMSYGSSDNEYQNCIALDMDRDDMSNVSYAMLGFLTHAYVSASEPDSSNNYWRGVIALNLKGTVNPGGDYPFGVLNDSGSSPNHNSGNTVVNSVFFDISGKGASSNNADSDLTISNTLVGEIAGTFGDSYGGSNVDLSIIDSIAYNWSRYAFNDIVQPAYSAVYDGESDTIYNSTTEGANMQTGDPTSNGLLYLVRIESGSTLATAGNSGGQIGPTILKRYGVDGTFYGESGYNTLTEFDLWPFPYEDQIKIDMASYSGGISGARGFAASGTQLDGVSDITLTSYIWEYLGNQMPSTIYGSGLTCYPDADNDLYPGSGSETVTTCSAGYYESSHFTAMTSDCNDNNAAINPGATEICGNGIDEDCSGADATCTYVMPIGAGTMPIGVGTMPITHD